MITVDEVAGLAGEIQDIEQDYSYQYAVSVSAPKKAKATAVLG